MFWVHIGYIMFRISIKNGGCRMLKITKKDEYNKNDFRNLIFKWFSINISKPIFLNRYVFVLCIFCLIVCYRNGGCRILNLAQNH